MATKILDLGLKNEIVSQLAGSIFGQFPHDLVRKNEEAKVLIVAEVDNIHDLDK